MKYTIFSIAKYRLGRMRGFTLVETLVAILALSLSLGALTLITARSIANSRDAELRLQAEMLALEGIEYVQLYATSKAVGSAGFVTMSDILLQCGLGCGFNPSAQPPNTIAGFFVCSNPANPCASILNGTNTSYVTSFSNNDGIVTGTATPFRRIVYTKPSPTSDGSVFVRVVVWYSPQGAVVPKLVSLTKEFRAWYTPQ